MWPFSCSWLNHSQNAPRRMKLLTHNLLKCRADMWKWEVYWTNYLDVGSRIKYWVPSRELTYPSQKALLSWSFSFSKGGNMDSFPGSWLTETDNGNMEPTMRFGDWVHLNRWSSENTRWGLLTTRSGFIPSCPSYTHLQPWFFIGFAGVITAL